MKEVINLHIGGAGVNTGSAIWELFCKEHDIDRSGQMPSDKTVGKGDDAFNSFFSETQSGGHVPRSVFVDTDSFAIDKIRNGEYGGIFNKDGLINGTAGTDGDYFKGYNATDIITQTIDRIRKEAEQSGSLDGFIITNSVGGGTGSGLTARLLESVSDEYGRKSKLGFNIYDSDFTEINPVEIPPKTKDGLSEFIYPAGKRSYAANVAQRYNSVLATHSIIEHIDVSFVLDNKALYNICANNLQIENTQYSHMNSVISQIYSSLTATLRFDGAINADLTEFRTNLVPYPRIKFMSTSYAPLSYVDVTTDVIDRSTFELTEDLFSSSCGLSSCGSGGKYMACCLMYRGYVVPKDVNAAVATIKKNTNIKFVDWCPTGFKCGINYQPGRALLDKKSLRSVCGVYSSTGIVDLLKNVMDDRVFNKKYVDDLLNINAKYVDDLLTINATNIDDAYNECIIDLKALSIETESNLYKIDNYVYNTVNKDIAEYTEKRDKLNTLRQLDPYYTNNPLYNDALNNINILLKEYDELENMASTDEGVTADDGVTADEGVTDVNA